MNTVNSWSSDISGTNPVVDIHNCGWVPEKISLKERIINIIKRDITASDCKQLWLNDVEKDTITFTTNENQVTIIRKSCVSLNEDLGCNYETNKFASVDLFNRLQKVFEKYNLAVDPITYTSQDQLGGPRYVFNILGDISDPYANDGKRVQLMLSTYIGTADRLNGFRNRVIYV